MNILTLIKRSPVVFPLACAAAVAMLFISETSYRQSVGKLRDLADIHKARTSVMSVERNLLYAETGQRGFLLTGRQEYLPAFTRAVNEINTSLDFLAQYHAARNGNTESLASLRKLVDTKRSEIELTIQLYGEGKADAARDIVLSNIGKEAMDAIRKINADMLAIEEANIRSSREELYRTLLISRIGLAALSAISLLALFLYLRQTATFEQHQIDLTELVQVERDRLDVEVRNRTARLTELTNHLQTAREDERSRLARNLHDELGALLTSAKLDAARIRSRLSGIAPEALERLTHLVSTLNESIALGRRIIEDLRPSTLSNLGLVATLEILAREYAERSGVEVHCALKPVTLEANSELVVYRVVQEAITNITKYAQARNVWLDLAPQAGQAVVSVRDDGIGFDTAAQRNPAYGLVGMRHRVEAEGGTLLLQSTPGQGTLIRVALPESTAAPVAATA